MAKEFDVILDECIDRLNHGETLESCLADYPEQADQLKPVLLAVTRVKDTLTFTPSDNALRSGRQRLYAALDKKHQPGFWQRTFSHRAVWVTVAAVLVVAIVTYFGLQTLGPPSQPSGGGIVQPPPAGSQVTTAVPPAVTTSAPSAAPPAVPTREPPTQFIVAANPNGNFVFLVSDEVNAIADFSSLNLVVEKIGLLQSGTSEKWLEFTPQVKEFDLSLLPGDKSLELWRGDIPAGQYNRVFIQVSQVTGVLKSTGKTLDIKLPSNKLQMSLNFEVSADSVTHFTYDLTVVNAGNGKNGGKYLLKPQITESGAKQIKK